MVAIILTALTPTLVVTVGVTLVGIALCTTDTAIPAIAAAIATSPTTDLLPLTTIATKAIG